MGIGGKKLHVGDNATGQIRSGWSIRTERRRASKGPRDRPGVGVKGESVRQGENEGVKSRIGWARASRGVNGIAERLAWCKQGCVGTDNDWQCRIDGKGQLKSRRR